MKYRIVFMIPLLLMASLALAGCKSDKERAAEHLSKAEELVQSGDTVRAGLEFRNALRLDPANRDARVDFAKMLEAGGNKAAAYGQYAAVVERKPDDLEALVAAARLAADLNDWKTAEEQTKAGLKIAPNNTMLQAVKAAVDYAKAVSARDDPAREAAGQTARRLIGKLPDNLLLRRIVIDNDIRSRRYQKALSEIDAALKIAPKAHDFYSQRLSVLAALNDSDGIETQLKQLVTLFPGDQEMEATLLRWYVSRNQLDKAEAYLRDLAAKAAPADRAKTDMSLVSFLMKYRSSDDALTTLDRIIASGDIPAAPATGDKAKDNAKAGPDLTVASFRAVRASIRFDKGERDKAVKDVQAVLKDAPATDETRRIKVMLAKMRYRMADAVGARALVEDVLSEDKGQAQALKLKAGWLIEDDDTDGAIALLRTALDAQPRDVQAMMLMAEAYKRAGQPDLMADMLSQAVDASNKAPAQSLRYADYLVGTGKDLVAENVLVDALRLDPKNVSLLAPLGRLYVKMKDWSRANGVVTRLEDINTPQANAAAQGLRPAILAGQRNMSAAVDYLQGLVDEGQGGIGTQVAVIRSLLAEGKPSDAKAAAEKLLAEKPEDPVRRFLMASVEAATGNVDGAEKTYRALLREDPKRDRIWLALVRLQAASGHPEKAAATAEEGLKVLPESPQLLQVRAGALEKAGKIEDAIAIYEKLYQKNSNDVITANNLATLLASYHGDDPKSLDRAWVVARRMVGTKVPAFADTFGWITYLRGDPRTALDYLQTAAKGLPADPMVQFHLAEVYRALKQPADARLQYQKVLDLVQKDDTRSFVETAHKYADAAPAAEN